MRTNLLVLMLAFFLFPLSGWGEEETVIDLSLSEYSGGYTINTNGTYRFTGTYTGDPKQKINDDDGVGRTAVINIGKNVTTTTIILDKVEIDLNNRNYCPLFAGDATTVTLKLIGENKLLALQNYGNCPGIWAPEDAGCELKIESYNNKDEDDILNVRGGGAFAGIGIDLLQGNNMITINSGTINAEGGTMKNEDFTRIEFGGQGIEVINDKSNFTTLTINGGIITATGKDGAAGIGGGSDHSGGTCTITGGTVTAIGGPSAAGIGGGSDHSGGTCTITGGTVTAIGGIYATGIGDGNIITGDGSGSICIITGGTVTATGGEDAAGIGDGYRGSGGTFTTTKDDQKGNAFIIASSISDQKNTDWSGIIFEGNAGKVYGTPIELTTDAIIPEGKTLTIDNSQILVNKEGITLVNKGTITNNGAITNNGRILLVGSGRIDGTKPANDAIKGFKVTYKSNYTDGPEDIIDYAASGDKLKANSFSRQYYTFDDWYDADGNNKVDQIKETTIVYAHWNPNKFNFKSPIAKQILIQNEKIEDINLSTLLEDNAITNCGKMTFTVSDNLPNGLSFNESTNSISGIPTEATEGEVSVTIKATAINTSEAEITIPFEVKNIDVIVSSPNENGWYANDITIAAPTGFKIRLDNSSSIVKSEPEFTDYITWNKDGAYTLTYSLQSITDDQEVYSNRTIDIQLDKTAPIISCTKDYLNYTLTFSDINGSGINELYIDNTLIPLTETSQNPDGSITYSGSFTEAGEHIAKVIDKAGHEASCTFELEKKPEDPYYPPYVPPVYYIVTLPTVEGVATDPEAGGHKVESWDSFSFLLTLDEGYQKDSHPVVKARGETVTPSASTGKYIIRNVRSDIMVEISGIVKDVATGNESLSGGFHITTSGRLLLVTVPRATRLYLTDTSGRLILSRLLPAGDTRIDELAAGVYLLTLEGEGTKKILLR